MERLAYLMFKGRMPRISDKLLEIGMATVATNTDLRSGEIKPFKALKQGSVLTASSISYRPIDTEKFVSTLDCNFVRHTVSDTPVLIVSDGTTYPKQYTDALYPADHRRLGVVAPTDILTMVFNTIGVIDDTEINKTVSYTYTYVTSWGEESAPAPATAAVDLQKNQYVTLSNFTTPDVADKNDVTGIRIYRLETGTQYADFQFLEEIDDLATTYDDYDENVGLNVVSDDIIPSEGWSEPPPTLAGIMRYANGMLAGFVGNTLYLSEPYIVYAWPAAYELTFDDPIVGIAAYANSIIVMTETKPYIVAGTAPENMRVTPVNVTEKCVSKRGIVESPVGVFYPSPNGIIHVSTGGAVNITKNIITKEQWNATTPANLISFWYDDMYMGFYNGTDTGAVIINGSWVDLDMGGGLVKGGYVDRASGELNLIMLRTATTYIESFNAHATDYLAWTWQSGITNMSFPSNFACMKIYGTLTGNVTTTVYGDGVSIFAQGIGNQLMRRLPGVSRYYDYQIKIASASGAVARFVESIILATSAETLRLN